MGEIGSALLSAVKTVGQIRQARNDILGGGSSTDKSDPGVSLSTDTLSSLYPNMPDLGMSGTQNANPQDPGTPVVQPDNTQAPQMPVPLATPAPQQDNPYGTDTYNDPRDIAKSIGTPDPNEIDVVGDRYTPKKESGIGRIMDTLLELHGRKPIFEDRTDNANFETAMKGYTSDPLQAIKRVATFAPQVAWKMFGEYKQNQTEDLKQQFYRDNQNETTFNQLGAIANSNDPAAAYQKALPILRSRLEANKTDSSILPDKWDPDIINTLRYSGFKTSEQESQKSTNAYRDAEFGLHRANTSSEIGTRAANLGLSVEGHQEDERHNRVMEDTAQQRADNNPDRGDGASLRDSKGNTVGVLSKDGLTATVVDPNTGKRGTFAVSRDARGNVRLGALMKVEDVDASSD